MVQYSPKRLAIREGYWGTHNTLQAYQKSKGIEVPMIDLDDEFQPGDVCWLETPVNPTGESRSVLQNLASGPIYS